MLQNLLQRIAAEVTNPRTLLSYNSGTHAGDLKSVTSLQTQKSDPVLGLGICTFHSLLFVLTWEKSRLLKCRVPSQILIYGENLGMDRSHWSSLGHWMPHRGCSNFQRAKNKVPLRTYSPSPLYFLWYGSSWIALHICLYWKRPNL